VDGVDLVPLRQLDDLVLGQVRGHRLQALAHQVGLVRLVAVQVDAVLLREDRDRAKAQLGAGAEDAHGDLAAVRSKHTAEGFDCHWGFEPANPRDLPLRPAAWEGGTVRYDWS